MNLLVQVRECESVAKEGKRRKYIGREKKEMGCDNLKLRCYTKGEAKRQSSIPFLPHCTATPLVCIKLFSIDPVARWPGFFPICSVQLDSPIHEHPRDMSPCVGDIYAIAAALFATDPSLREL